MNNAKDYLLQIPAFAREKHSLEEAKVLFSELGCPFPGKVIHVAGTNGKGSVCSFLSSVLYASGCRVGTFTSPHLVDIRERISINGTMVGEERFEKSFQTVLQAVRRMEKRGYEHPTFFEFLFYMAAVCFYEEKLDYVILETGMGGRLDITNLCCPAVTAITSVSLDHMAYLGNTVRKIAGEKAGIIKTGVPVVYDGNDREAAVVIREAARQQGAPCLNVREEGWSWEMKHQFPEISGRFQGEPVKMTLPFPAAYQVWNSVVAVKILELLKDRRVTGDSLKRGIQSARWEGRMEEVLPDVFLDGAHNRDGIQAFCDSASRILYDRKKKAVLLFAAVSDKEYRTMAEELVCGLKPERIFVACLDSSRSLDIESMKTAFQTAECPVIGFSNVKEALCHGLEQKQEDEILFCAGSLYFVGELKHCLREENYDKF